MRDLVCATRRDYVIGCVDAQAPDCTDYCHCHNNIQCIQQIHDSLPPLHEIQGAVLDVRQAAQMAGRIVGGPKCGAIKTSEWYSNRTAYQPFRRSSFFSHPQTIQVNGQQNIVGPPPPRQIVPSACFPRRYLTSWGLHAVSAAPEPRYSFRSRSSKVKDSRLQAFIETARALQRDYQAEQWEVGCPLRQAMTSRKVNTPCLHMFASPHTSH